MSRLVLRIPIRKVYTYVPPIYNNTPNNLPIDHKNKCLASICQCDIKELSKEYKETCLRIQYNTQEQNKTLAIAAMTGVAGVLLFFGFLELS